MKKLFLYIFLIISSMALVSCYWIAGTSGANLTLNLSGLSVKAPGDRYARIYLVANSRIYPLREDTEYVEIPLAPISNPEIQLTLEDIPVGPLYRVWLSIGTEQSGGWFHTENWAESDTFELSPGQETVVPFSEQELLVSPFEPVGTVMGKKLKDVEHVGGMVYTADSETLYTDLFSALTEIPLEPTYTVNSLTKGLDYSSQWGNQQLWINSNKGILPYVVTVAPYFDTNFSSALGPVSILDSAARNTTVQYQHIVFFRRENGLGGVLILPDFVPTDWTWVNKDYKGITDLIAAYGDSTYSTYNGDAYFASTTGAFRLASDLLTDPDLNKHRTPFSAPSRVISLGLQDINGDGDQIFMGTENGAWYASPTYDASVIGVPQFETGTEGHRILMTSVSDYPHHRAYFSAIYLLIVTMNPSSGSETLSVYPIVAGLPGKMTGMTWQTVTTDDYYLYVSGEEGLVRIYVSPYL